MSSGLMNSTSKKLTKIFNTGTCGSICNLLQSVGPKLSRPNLLSQEKFPEMTWWCFMPIQELLCSFTIFQWLIKMHALNLVYSWRVSSFWWIEPSVTGRDVFDDNRSLSTLSYLWSFMVWLLSCLILEEKILTWQQMDDKWSNDKVLTL